MAPKWPIKDGTYKNKVSGGLRYIRVSAGPQRHQYVHILIAEAMLGRELTEDETVDHIDQNTLNNRWDNLQVVTRSEHGKITRAREVSDA